MLVVGGGAGGSSTPGPDACADEAGFPADSQARRDATLEGGSGADALDDTNALSETAAAHGDRGGPDAGRGTADADSHAADADDGPPDVAIGCVAASDCDDRNPCTRDECRDGLCVASPLAEGSGCDDGLLCTTADACRAGKCVGTPSATAAGAKWRGCTQRPKVAAPRPTVPIRLGNSIGRQGFDSWRAG